MQNNALASIAADVHHCHVMHTPTCPKCGDAIASTDINVASDVAFCRSCNYSASLSGLTRGLIHDPNVDLGNPPPGAWYRDNGTEKVIGASGRSIKSAIGMLFVTLVWNGVLSIFVLLVLVATLKHLGKPIPAWMPAFMAKSGGDISKIMSACMWLFLTPFMLIGIALPFAVLNYLFGHTEVRMTDTKGSVFRGIGFFGRTTYFNPVNVRAVRFAERRMHGSMRHQGDRDTFSKSIAIELADADPISFGVFLTEKRMSFVVSALNVAMDLDRKRV